MSINWHEAYQYAKWLTEQTEHQYRLPSKIEWESAAEAGTKTLYWWGMKLGKKDADCSICGRQVGWKKTAPVGF